MTAPLSDICAIVPCFNEARHVARLVPEILRHVKLCVVVDDGSRDDTATAAERGGARVVRFEHNRGKGAALKAGFEVGRNEGCVACLTLDGDGQHDPRDIPLFLERFKRGDCDAVLGNRLADAHVMPWTRKTANTLSSRWISRAADREILDSQCGFRLIRVASWYALSLECERFDLETEFLLKAARQGVRLVHVPVRTLYSPDAPSRIKPLRDVWRFFRALSRYRKEPGGG